MPQGEDGKGIQNSSRTSEERSGCRCEDNNTMHLKERGCEGVQ